MMANALLEKMRVKARQEEGERKREIEEKGGGGGGGRERERERRVRSWESIMFYNSLCVCVGGGEGCEKRFNGT